MVKKFKFLSLLKNTRTSSFSSSFSWGWPYCHPPQTLSFRATKNDVVFQTIINPTYIDAAATTTATVTTDIHEISDSVFTESPLSAASFSTASEIESRSGADPIEIPIRSSDRISFDPEKTSSICEANNAGKIASDESLASPSPFDNSLVLSVDSVHPQADFKDSMAEMVAAYDVKTWEGLEELLYLLLKLNEEANHEHIVGAFLDFLKDLPAESICVGDQQKEVQARPPRVLEQIREDITPEEDDEA